MNDMSSSYVESIIKKALDGSMTARHAARKLGISRQYVNRLKKQCLAKGIKAFDHGNKGKERAWKTGPGTKAKTIELYGGKYSGFNFRHYHEKLTEVEGIGVSKKRILHSNFYSEKTTTLSFFSKLIFPPQEIPYKYTFSSNSLELTSS